MEEKDDIFKFEDFLGGNKIDDLKKMKSKLLKEGLFSDDDLEISDDFGTPEDEYEINKQSSKELRGSDFLNSDGDDGDDIIDQNLNPYNVDDSYLDETDNSLEESNDYYKLYRDKSEDFICDIAIEGVNQNDTEVRLIIESDDWNLMFIGEIKNGKCIIPVKKLNILNEGQTGNIKLEVNADGNLFTPWEDKFVVKVSKKVTVNVNENRNNKIKKSESKHKMGVKVNVKK